MAGKAVEFFGGPLDGEKRVVPDGMRVYTVPLPAEYSAALSAVDNEPDCMPPHREVRYELSGRGMEFVGER